MRNNDEQYKNNLHSKEDSVTIPKFTTPARVLGDKDVFHGDVAMRDVAIMKISHGREQP